MKQLLFITALSLIFILSASTYAEKVAVINIAEVFKDIVTKKAITKKLEKEFKVQVNELLNMEKDLQFQVKKLQRSVIDTSNKDFQEFEFKRTNFLKKAKQLEQDNQLRQQEECYKILQVIKMATKAVAEKEHYDVVVDLSTVIYPENRFKLKNITDLVIKKVNNK